MITSGLREENWSFSTDPTWKTSNGQFLPVEKRRGAWQGCVRRMACAH